MDLDVVFEHVPLLLSIVGHNLEPLLCRVCHVVKIVVPKVVFVQVMERQKPISGVLVWLNIGPTVQSARDVRYQLPHLEAIRLVRKQNHAWRAFMRGTRNNFILHAREAVRRVHNRYRRFIPDDVGKLDSGLAQVPT